MNPAFLVVGGLAAASFMRNMRGSLAVSSLGPTLVDDFQGFYPFGVVHVGDDGLLWAHMATYHDFERVPAQLVRLEKAARLNGLRAVMIVLIPFPGEPPSRTLVPGLKRHGYSKTKMKGIVSQYAFYQKNLSKGSRAIREMGPTLAETADDLDFSPFYYPREGGFLHASTDLMIFHRHEDRVSEALDRLEAAARRRRLQGVVLHFLDGCIPDTCRILVKRKYVFYRGKGLPDKQYTHVFTKQGSRAIHEIGPTLMDTSDDLDFNPFWYLREGRLFLHAYMNEATFYRHEDQIPVALERLKTAARRRRRRGVVLHFRDGYVAGSSQILAKHEYVFYRGKALGDVRYIYTFPKS